MASKLKMIFIPGNGGGSVKDGWFPSVAQELEKLGLIPILEEYPDSQLAREKYWLPYITQLGADEKTILIGHSSGAEAAMRYAEQHPVFGSILVSPCYTDMGMEQEKLSGYYNRPWEWEQIKNNQHWIIQFSSTDDPWIPITEARFVHEKLATEYYEYTDQGHFGGDREMKTFPDLITALQKKL